MSSIRQHKELNSDPVTKLEFTVFGSMLRKLCKQTIYGLTAHQKTTKLNVNEFIIESKTTKFLTHENKWFYSI